MARINYNQLLDDALKNVVKESLLFAQFNGLGDDTSFFITFRTHDAGVVLPDFLKIKYPDTMTIALQYSYNNLNVSDKEFGVQLTFDGRPFFIRVPFSALVEFKDPISDFILPFRETPRPQLANSDMELPLEDKQQSQQQNPKIISMDEFRKKQLKN